MALFRSSRVRATAVITALLALVVVATGFTAATVTSSRPSTPAAARPVGGNVLASLPLAFEPAGSGGFVSHGPGYSLALDAGDATLAVDGGAFRLRPAGATAGSAAPLIGRNPLPGTVTRLHGDDAGAWSAGVATYGAVVAPQVWPGVDMVWHGNQRRLEHDMVVAPGADPAAVALDVEGARSLAVDSGGDLVIDLGGTTTRMARPVVYQDGPGGRRSVAGTFELLDPTRIGFRLGSYDRTLPLVIDPTLLTSTLLGGTGADNGYGIATDKEGNTYVVGSTESADFPTRAPIQPKLALPSAVAGSTSDVFVSKINPAGTALVWSTYLGGGGRDTAYGVAVGADGGVYVTGVTESPDFPRARAAQDRYGGGPSDAFVARINANGSSLDWSTFVGGSQTDGARGVTVDPSGAVYITGSTSSVDFPSIGAQQAGPFRPDDFDAFVVKIPATGAPLAYATRLGGSNDDHGLAIAVDAQGSAYVTGDTLSPGFPTVRPFQAGAGGSANGVAGSFPDAFVTKYSPSGSALVYSTFLGGSDVDQGTAIAVDATGAAYVAGNTNSPNFPTAAAIQPRKDADSDAFVAKLDPPGAALVYSTYYGGTGADGANGIAVDATGAAVIVGTTGSTNWPTSRALQPAKAGGSDAFVLKLNPAGISALFSSFVGGRDEDQGMGVALDVQGTAHLLGITASNDFPALKPLQPGRVATAGDAFVATLSLTDATAPVAATPVPASSTGHDRRVRALGILTLVLLLGAVAQTVYLRTRPRTPSPGPARDGPARGGRPEATAGLRVLPEDADATVASTPRIGASAQPGPAAARVGGAAKSGAAGAKAGASRAGGSKGSGSKGGGSKSGSKAGPSKSSRAPKARGGPKGGVPGRPGAPTTPPPPASPREDEGGEPTQATPMTPPAAPGPVHEPAIAQLLEEDMWRRDPEPTRAVPTGLWERLADDRSGEVAEVPVEQGMAPPAPGSPASQTPGPPPADTPPAAGIPPLPAEELSFWDLFPEDLPPARAGGFTVDEMVTDDPLLPADDPLPPAGDLRTGSPARPDLPSADQLSPTPTPPPRPSEGQPPPPWSPPAAAELVIAELLEGPPPAGWRASAELEPAAQEPDGFFVGDLLADREPPAARAAAAATGDVTRGGDHEDDSDDSDDASSPVPAVRTPEEQARIAADRARRRRTRRGGRRNRPAGGGSG